MYKKCVQLVHDDRQNHVQSFPQQPQLVHIARQKQAYYPQPTGFPQVSAQRLSHVLHKYFLQMTPEIVRFYPLSAPPITTITIYI